MPRRGKLRCPLVRVFCFGSNQFPFITQVLLVSRGNLRHGFTCETGSIENNRDFAVLTASVDVGGNDVEGNLCIVGPLVLSWCW